jgi:acyl-CoA reductase-like NAD-dependent aldehyde dehydrogenase
VADRLPVKKTYKLFIGGAFPRSESGRTFEAEGQNVARASRKDVRDAVRAARDGYGKWSVLTAYNRGQVLYRVAEMMEARRDEFAAVSSGKKEVDRAIDLAPDEPALAGLVSRIAPALVGGNAVVAVASETHPLAAIELAEVLATSDVPGGAVNILTGYREELAPWLAGHMDVNAIDVTGADGLSADVERLAADNVKRVVRGQADGQSAWQIADFLELKTVWHPIGR